MALGVCTWETNDQGIGTQIPILRVQNDFRFNIAEPISKERFSILIEGLSSSRQKSFPPTRARLEDIVRSNFPVFT